MLPGVALPCPGFCGGGPAAGCTLTAGHQGGCKFAPGEEIRKPRALSGAYIGEHRGRHYLVVEPHDEPGMTPAQGRALASWLLQAASYVDGARAVGSLDDAAIDAVADRVVERLAAIIKGAAHV